MRIRGLAWTPRTVASVEAGTRPLQLEELVVVADYFDVTIAALVMEQAGTRRVALNSQLSMGRLELAQVLGGGYAACPQQL